MIPLESGSLSNSRVGVGYVPSDEGDGFQKRLAATTCRDDFSLTTRSTRKRDRNSSFSTCEALLSKASRPSSSKNGKKRNLFPHHKNRNMNITRRTFVKRTAFTAAAVTVLGRGVALAEPGNSHTDNSTTTSTTSEPKFLVCTGAPWPATGQPYPNGQIPTGQMRCHSANNLFDNKKLTLRYPTSMQSGK